MTRDLLATVRSVARHRSGAVAALMAAVFIDAAVAGDARAAEAIAADYGFTADEVDAHLDAALDVARLAVVS